MMITREGAIKRERKRKKKGEITRERERGRDYVFVNVIN